MAETYTMFINPKFDYEQRINIGNAAISYIIRRTKRGHGIGDKKFTGPDGDGKYSENYVNTVDFQIAGKSAGKVNLTLSGDMLNSIEIIDASLAGRIIIGITDEENANKAKWMREKGYNFLGLSNEEKTRIESQFGNNAQQTTASLVQSIAESFVRSLFRG